MVRVSIKIPLSNCNYINGLPTDIVSKDNNLVECNIIQSKGPDNWGDDDCPKMVSDVTKAEVILKDEVAKQYIKRPGKIDFIRYHFYNPAYHFDKTNQEYTIINDSLVKITIG